MRWGGRAVAQTLLPMLGWLHPAQPRHCPGHRIPGALTNCSKQSGSVGTAWCNTVAKGLTGSWLHKQRRRTREGTSPPIWLCRDGCWNSSSSIFLLKRRAETKTWIQCKEAAQKLTTEDKMAYCAHLEQLKLLPY